jgi:hydroxymethylpyrimidine pyrophosphatase-like HAD family hydrolase
LSSLATFSFDKLVTNISMIGQTERIQRIADLINEQDSLIAYSGPAIEGDDYYWMDIHHRLANKGSAVMALKEKVGAQNVICFGDSQNDISMFKCADECYAPSNAKPYIKDLATDIIGHHDEDGVSKFLVERFSL